MITVAISGAEARHEKRAIVEMLGALNEHTDLNLPDGQVNIRLVDDTEIRALNKEYSGQDAVTDVLSFSYIEDGKAIEGEIGDVAISLERAKEQAAQAGTGLSEEVALLALHGILHIAHYDHGTPTADKTLDNLQAQILKEAGLRYRKFDWKDKTGD